MALNPKLTSKYTSSLIFLDFTNVKPTNQISQLINNNLLTPTMNIIKFITNDRNHLHNSIFNKIYIESENLMTIVCLFPIQINSLTF